LTGKLVLVIDVSGFTMLLDVPDSVMLLEVDAAGSAFVLDVDFDFFVKMNKKPKKKKNIFTMLY
jgi:hypothetical protein